MFVNIVIVFFVRQYIFVNFVLGFMLYYCTIDITFQYQQQQRRINVYDKFSSSISLQKLQKAFVEKSINLNDYEMLCQCIIKKIRRDRCVISIKKKRNLIVYQH